MFQSIKRMKSKLLQFTWSWLHHGRWRVSSLFDNCSDFRHIFSGVLFKFHGCIFIRRYPTLMVHFTAINRLRSSKVHFILFFCQLFWKLREFFFFQKTISKSDFHSTWWASFVTLTQLFCSSRFNLHSNLLVAIRFDCVLFWTNQRMQLLVQMSKEINS